MTPPTKTVIITGGNAGLGYQCAKALTTGGNWHIAIASRHLGRVDSSVERLKTETGHDSITSHELDLGSFASVRAFAKNFAQMGYPPLHAIVCNAGLSPKNNRGTVEGIDVVFGVNHLGHYLLVHLLSKVLVPNEGARVVFVSSGTHLPNHMLARAMGVPCPNYSTAMNLAYPEQAPEQYRMPSPQQRYSTSKLCNVLCAYELSRQFKARKMDVSVFSLDPGLMGDTDFARDFPKILVTVIFRPLVKFLSLWHKGVRTAAESGQDLARLVTDPQLRGRSALYFDGKNEVPSSEDSYDRKKAEDLWNTSAKLCGLEEQETVLPLAVQGDSQ